MTNETHTPGAWRLQSFDECQTAILPDRGQDKRHALIAIVSVGEARPDGDANARLITAAANSYDKHCGPRAVACAEGDLLGELLAALEESDRLLTVFRDRILSPSERVMARGEVVGAVPETVRAALRKARGAPGPTPESGGA